MEGKAQCTIAISFLTKNVTFSMGRHCAYMKASSMQVTLDATNDTQTFNNGVGGQSKSNRILVFFWFICFLHNTLEKIPKCILHAYSLRVGGIFHKIYGLQIPPTSEEQVYEFSHHVHHNLHMFGCNKKRTVNILMQTITSQLQLYNSYN